MPETTNTIEWIKEDLVSGRCSLILSWQNYHYFVPFFRILLFLQIAVSLPYPTLFLVQPPFCNTPPAVLV